jgi:recombinational DNA repair ATPase RecF
MKVSKLELMNIKSYEGADIDLSPKINLLVGNNNSGKSVILTVL